MGIEYLRATVREIDLLTETRIRVLRAANGLDDWADMSEVERSARAYYRTSIPEGSHVAYLVMDGGRVAGAGGISFYRVMPTFNNPSGEKAYLMNIFTDPEYRRQGIAFRTLDLLVREAKARGITSIALETTDMGRPLYEKYGFVPCPREMELPKE